MLKRTPMKLLSERVNTYIVVWSGTEHEPIFFDGSSFYVPGRDQIAQQGMGSLYRFPAAETRAGAKIAGTIVVSDQYGTFEGNRLCTFEAKEFVKFLENSRQDLLNRGLSIVEMPEEVEEAKALGIPLFEASLDNRAQEILQKELARRQKWEDKGIVAPISSSEADVVWARAHLDSRRTLKQSSLSTNDIRAALSGVPGQPIPQAPANVAPRKRLTEDDENLFLQATQFGIDLKKAQMAGLLAKDPEVMAEVRGLVASRRESLMEMATAPQETPAAP